MLRIDDDLGRTLMFGRAPRRIVSLVPSDTYSVVALGAGDRLVGRTTLLRARRRRSATVGGTKDVDVEAVVALEPDLVIANQEENARKPLEALAARGVPVLVSLPRTVDQGIAHLARLARILEVGDGAARARAPWLCARAGAGRRARRAFVPIWMDPLMTLNADTFGSDVLARVGIANAFGDRLRLYPLAADLGKTRPEVEAPGRDVRYPRITLDEVATRGRGSDRAARRAARVLGRRRGGAPRARCRGARRARRRARICSGTARGRSRRSIGSAQTWPTRDRVECASRFATGDVAIEPTADAARRTATARRARAPSPSAGRRRRARDRRGRRGCGRRYGASAASATARSSSAIGNGPSTRSASPDEPRRLADRVR